MMTFAQSKLTDCIRSTDQVRIRYIRVSIPLIYIVVALHSASNFKCASWDMHPSMQFHASFIIYYVMNNI